MSCWTVGLPSDEGIKRGDRVHYLQVEMIQRGRLCGLELKPLRIAGTIDRQNPQDAAISRGGLARGEGPISLHQTEACSRIYLLAVYVRTDHDAAASKLLAEIKIE